MVILSSHKGGKEFIIRTSCADDDDAGLPLQAASYEFFAVPAFKHTYTHVFNSLRDERTGVWAASAVLVIQSSGGPICE